MRIDMASRRLGPRSGIERHPVSRDGGLEGFAWGPASGVLFLQMGVAV